MSTVDGRDTRAMPVRHAMSPEVLGIVPEAPLEVALRMMVEARVRHLPVVPTVDVADNVRTAARRMAEVGTDFVLDAGRVAGSLTTTNLVRLIADG
jgi:CBS domain-containing protein